ncbi:unnamed protein product [Ilex paraguariensis]|uniref:Proteasome subunit beta type-3-A n=1 Tax=Ilex paraguariensis TaxID=185542 RepID=A0ABC8TJR2_9AQUA
MFVWLIAVAMPSRVASVARESEKMSCYPVILALIFLHCFLPKCRELAKDFVVAGTASESLYGACESMFKPDMEPEELFETISQALLSSVDRDCLSGWGGHVYVVTPTEVTERMLKGRMD